MRKSSVRTSLIVILIALSTIITMQNPVKAQGDPNIYVSDQFPTGSSNFIFHTNTTTVGFKFNVTLNVNNGTLVWAWQVRMNYNSTFLNATRAWIVPASDPDYILSGQSSLRPAPSLSSGSVLIGDTILVGTSVNFTSPKKLGIIEFEIMASPPPGTGSKLSSVLDITNVDTYLLDDLLNEISTTKTNGLYEFNYVPPATQISLSANPSTLNYGGAVRLSGRIDTVPANASMTFVGFAVAITHRVGSSGPFTNVTTALTNSTSGYSYNWQTAGEVAGLHEFRTYWAGNATYSGAISSIASVNVQIPAGSPTIYVRNPLTGTSNFIFYTSTTAVSSRFNATVYVNNGTLIFGWQARLNYNATCLNATRAWVPDSDSQYIFFGLSTLLPAPSFSTGSILIGDTVLGATDNVNFTTPQKLGIIEFQIMAAPPTGGKVSSILNINIPSDTYLLDTNLAEVPTVKTNGLYELRQGSKPASQITISARPASVGGGATVTINGTITTAPNARVTIWRRLGTTGTFSNLTTVTTNSSSMYTYAWTSAGAGTHQFKANWTGNDDYLSAESTVVSVTVTKANSTITLIVTPDTVKAGENVTLSGIVGPTRANVNVNLTSGTTILGTATTDANGAYTFEWKTTTEGTYTITASWLGDNTYNGATSTAESVTVEPAPPTTDYTIYYIIAAIVIIVIILIILYWYMRRRRESQESQK